MPATATGSAMNTSMRGSFMPRKISVRVSYSLFTSAHSLVMTMMDVMSACGERERKKKLAENRRFDDKNAKAWQLLAVTRAFTTI